jgi:hypothetical protein
MNRTTTRTHDAREIGRHARIALWLAIVSLLPAVARADGPVLLARESRSPLVISIFTSGAVTAGTRTQVAVLVQRGETNEVLLEATVNLTFTPPGGRWPSPQPIACGDCDRTLAPAANDANAAQGESAPQRATRDQGVNQLLATAAVVFPFAGEWQLRASIEQGGDETSMTSTLVVGEAPRRLAGLWPELLLPWIAIALFVANQVLRRRQLGRSATDPRLPPSSSRAASGSRHSS